MGRIWGRPQCQSCGKWVSPGWAFSSKCLKADFVVVVCFFFSHFCPDVTLIIRRTVRSTEALLPLSEPEFPNGLLKTFLSFLKPCILLHPSWNEVRLLSWTCKVRHDPDPGGLSVLPVPAALGGTCSSLTTPRPAVPQGLHVLLPVVGRPVSLCPPVPRTSAQISLPMATGYESVGRLSSPWLPANICHHRSFL